MHQEMNGSAYVRFGMKINASRIRKAKVVLLAVVGTVGTIFEIAVAVVTCLLTIIAPPLGEIINLAIK